MTAQEIDKFVENYKGDPETEDRMDRIVARAASIHQELANGVDRARPKAAKLMDMAATLRGLADCVERLAREVPT